MEDENLTGEQKKPESVEEKTPPPNAPSPQIAQAAPGIAIQPKSEAPVEAETADKIEDDPPPLKIPAVELPAAEPGLDDKAIEELLAPANNQKSAAPVSPLPVEKSASVAVEPEEAQAANIPASPPVQVVSEEGKNVRPSVSPALDAGKKQHIPPQKLDDMVNKVKEKIGKFLVCEGAAGDFAGIKPRFFAALLDVVLWILPLHIIFAFLPDSMISVEIFIIAGVFAYFTSSVWQATPGKRIMDLYIKKVEGGPMTALQAAGRAFAYLPSFLILLGGFIMIAFTEQNKALHDIICKTRVVHGRPD